jgi:outer membrane protein
MTRSISIVVLLLVGSAAYAQQPAPIALSLEDAQARAVAASHRLAEARARAGVAEAAVTVRERATMPTVGVSAAYTRTNHVTEFVVPGPTGVPRVLYPDVPNDYFSRLSLQWPIYTGGRTDALEAAARAEAAAATSDVAMAEADLRLEVTRVFWALVTAGATIDVVEQSLARTRAHLGDVRERFKAGLIPPNEVAAAEAQESRQRMLAIEAMNQRRIVSAELARLVGAGLGEILQPTETLDGSPAQAPEDRLEDAQARRSERRAIEQRIEAADLQRQALLAATRPTVAITAGADYARPNPRIFPRADRWDESWDAGVAVSWSLWDGGRARAEAAQAAAGITAARQRLAEFDSVLALELRSRLLEIDSGRAAVAAAQDAIRSATEARRVVNERYRAGVATQTEVLDADIALLQAELDRTRALAGVRLAEARLARAAGR